MNIAEIYSKLDFLSTEYRVYCTNFIIKNIYSLDINYVLEKLKQDMPIEYILNKSYFYGNDFFVDQRCLIPRPDTEEIVIRFIHDCIPFFKDENIYNIFDIGSGSGNIIISVVMQIDIFLKNVMKKDRKYANLKINYYAVEKSKKALDVMQINLKRYKMFNKINVINMDFRKVDYGYLEGETCFLANLPYIGEKEYVHNSVLKYEPYEALFAGNNGDELNNDLISIFKTNQNIKYLIYETKGGEIRNAYK